MFSFSGRTSPTLAEVSGKADESCLQQLLKVFLECSHNDHIVTVSPGDVQTASSLSGNLTQREREHQYEATLKKEARGRIQTLHRDLRKIKQLLSCKEDELATCEEKISAKHCEQKHFESDVDANQANLGGKYEELQSLNENIEKAQKELIEKRRECQTEEIAVSKAENELNDLHNAIRDANKELTQTQEKNKQVSKELNDQQNAVRAARKELKIHRRKINKYRMTGKKNQGRQKRKRYGLRSYNVDREDAKMEF